jgi:hypothetical protein
MGLAASDPIMFMITAKSAATRVREWIYRGKNKNISLRLCCRLHETEKGDKDPYRPPVGTTPLDDTPFVIEAGDKLPAGNGGVSPEICITEQTYIYSPSTVCKSFTDITVKIQTGE